MTTESPTTCGAAVRSSDLVRRFDDWTDAFAICREMDKPITVAMPFNDVVEIARIFPSGRCKHVRYEPPNVNVSDPAL